MPFRFACGDLEPGCASTFDEKSEEALWAAATSHCRVAHDRTEFGPDVYDAFAQHVSFEPANSGDGGASSAPTR